MNEYFCRYERFTHGSAKFVSPHVFPPSRRFFLQGFTGMNYSPYADDRMEHSLSTFYCATRECKKSNFHSRRKGDPGEKRNESRDAKAV